MNSGMSVKFNAGHHAVVVLLGLGAILVLPLARMPLLNCWSCTGNVPDVFFQAVFVIWPIAVWESQLWHSYLGRDHVYSAKKVKLQSCRQQPVFPRRSRSVLGKLWFFWLLMWHFMNSARSVKFDAGHHAVVVLLGLGALLVLPLARMPLLKLYWQRATSVLPSCVCYLAHLGPHLWSKRSSVRITTLGQPPDSRV